MQIVPEQTEEEAKTKAEREKAARLGKKMPNRLVIFDFTKKIILILFSLILESAHTDLLLKLMQQSHRPQSNKRQTNAGSSAGPRYT